jgi:P-type E1-E2 ATPase
MIEIDVPGWRRFRLSDLVLDVNGVLALDGKLLPSVPARIARLQPALGVHLLSADTYGLAMAIAADLGVSITRLRDDGNGAAQKAAYVRDVGSAAVVAIGNGRNDAEMLGEAALGIGVMGHEGLAGPALLASDVIVGSVHEALDLLLYPKRLIATLRR